jgi:hypothetical protein
MDVLLNPDKIAVEILLIKLYVHLNLQMQRSFKISRTNKITTMQHLTTFHCHYCFVLNISALLLSEKIRADLSTLVHPQKLADSVRRQLTIFFFLQCSSPNGRQVKDRVCT